MADCVNVTLINIHEPVISLAPDVSILLRLCEVICIPVEYKCCRVVSCDNYSNMCEIIRTVKISPKLGILIM